MRCVYTHTECTYIYICTRHNLEEYCTNCTATVLLMMFNKNNNNVCIMCNYLLLLVVLLPSFVGVCIRVYMPECVFLCACVSMMCINCNTKQECNSSASTMSMLFLKKKYIINIHRTMNESAESNCNYACACNKKSTHLCSCLYVYVFLCFSFHCSQLHKPIDNG